MSDVECFDCYRPLADCKYEGGPTTTSGSDRVACPYCGEQIKDLCEYGDDVEYDDLKAECGHCEKPFKLSRRVSVSYTARRA